VSERGPSFLTVMTTHEYAVTVRLAQPRAIAAVRIRLPMQDVPRRFADYLNQVYAASRTGAIELDGQNIFVYRGDAHGEADVEFGVGTRRPFERTGAVVHSATPAGRVATTTHWGDYAGLGAAHDAVVAWCRSQGHAIAGPRWEVYGHWSDDPAARRTDIFYLLKDDAAR
jgi:effector-binding domain-containing protein